MFKLGVNTGFAVNRYTEPDVWTSIVADEFGVDVIQFTATLLDPRWPSDYVMKQADYIRRLCDSKGIRIQTTFTDAFTRLNHVTSPDPEMRQMWVDWFKKLVDISEVLGAEGIGSHFGILSFRDNDDPARRMQMLREGCRNWAEIADYASQKGLEYVYFEPMSIPREFAETIDETRTVLDMANEDITIPMLLCLDVDHGYLQSTNPDDIDPYKWLEAFAVKSPVIHLKQSRSDKGGHHPFTAEHNIHGKISPDKVLETLLNAGSTDNTLILEFAHKERWPSEYTVIQDFQESIGYWREALVRFDSKVSVNR